MELEEKFKDIPTFEGLYMISTEGNVKFIKRIISKKDGTIQTFKERLLNARISSKGYMSVVLTKDGKSRMYNVHSLLGLTFIDANYLKNKLTVNHKDGNKLNNSLSNLEVVSYSENNLHAINSGLRSNVGETHPNAKITDEQVAEIRKEYSENYYYGIGRDLALRYGIKKSNLSSIVNGNKRNQHLKTKDNG